MDGLNEMMREDLKKELSRLKINGRSRLTTKKQMCEELFRLGYCRSPHNPNMVIKNDEIDTNKLQIDEYIQKGNNINDLLYEKTFDKDTDIITKIIQNYKVDLNYGLWGAIGGCHIDLIEIFIKFPAIDLDVALHYSIVNNVNLDIIELLLDKGANLQDTLLLTIKNGSPANILFLMNLGANDLDEAFYEALECSNYEIISFLLEFGYVSATNHLYNSLYQNNIDHIKLILQCGNIKINDLNILKRLINLILTKCYNLLDINNNHNRKYHHLFKILTEEVTSNLSFEEKYDLLYYSIGKSTLYNDLELISCIYDQFDKYSVIDVY